MVISGETSINYWRKEIFPYYKQNRKKSRESSNLDWDSIFQTLNKIRDEIKENFPYKTIEVMNAEADDIIASLVFKMSKNPLPKDILIITECAKTNPREGDTVNGGGSQSTNMAGQGLITDFLFKYFKNYLKYKKIFFF